MKQKSKKIGKGKKIAIGVGVVLGAVLIGVGLAAIFDRGHKLQWVDIFGEKHTYYVPDITPIWDK